MNAPRAEGKNLAVCQPDPPDREARAGPASVAAGHRVAQAGAESWAPVCLVCAGHSTPVFRAAEFRMFRCAKCRSAFVWPQPSADELRRFYARFHEGHGGYYDADVERRVRADFAAKSALVRSHVAGPTPRVLDVGCGKGFFVKDCRDRGIQAEGIDLSASAVRFASEVLGVPATCGRLEDQAATLGRFDAITLWATIEHLPDPLATLRTIHHMLVPGGYLFLDTGVGDDWLDRLLPGVNQWYDPPQHLFVFSIAGMRRCLEVAGFEVVRVDSCFERTQWRRVARMARAFGLAAGLRMLATLGRMRIGPEPSTRFPLGNLMNVIARRPAVQP